MNHGNIGGIQFYLSLHIIQVWFKKNNEKIKLDSNQHHFS